MVLLLLLAVCVVVLVALAMRVGSKNSPPPLAVHCSSSSSAWWRGEGVYLREGGSKTAGEVVAVLDCGSIVRTVAAACGAGGVSAVSVGEG